MKTIENELDLLSILTIAMIQVSFIGSIAFSGFLGYSLCCEAYQSYVGRKHIQASNVVTQGLNCIDKKRQDLTRDYETKLSKIIEEKNRYLIANPRCRGSPTFSNGYIDLDSKVECYDDKVISYPDFLKKNGRK